jgi:hypothetical protein
MVSSGTLRHVALVRTDISEEPSASFIRVTRIGQLATSNRRTLFLRNVRRLLVAASVVPSSPILVTLMKVLGYSETAILTRATWRSIPEDTILHSHHRENLKSYNSCQVYNHFRLFPNIKIYSTKPWFRKPDLYGCWTVTYFTTSHRSRIWNMQQRGNAINTKYAVCEHKPPDYNFQKVYFLSWNWQRQMLSSGYRNIMQELRKQLYLMIISCSQKKANAMVPQQSSQINVKLFK